jgi:hypothetical protein
MYTKCLVHYDGRHCCACVLKPKSIHCSESQLCRMLEPEPKCEQRVPLAGYVYDLVTAAALQDALFGALRLAMTKLVAVEGLPNTTSTLARLRANAKIKLELMTQEVHLSVLLSDPRWNIFY